MRGEAWLVVGLTAGVAEGWFLESVIQCVEALARGAVGLAFRSFGPAFARGLHRVRQSAALTAEVLFLPPAWLALQCRQIKARHLPWCGSPTGTRAEQGTR